MPVTTSGPRRCEVCGDPIRADNKYGICTDQAKPGCVAARRRKRLGLPEPGEKTCGICGRPLRCDNRTGICSDRGGNSECRRVRKRMDRGLADPMGQPHRIVIKPGDTFGLWTALEEYIPKKRKGYVLCRCECGNETPVRAANLNREESKSCGRHPRKARLRKGPPYLQAGAVFGRLTVLEDVAYAADDASCRCECGNPKTARAADIKHGNVKSCNCLWRELNVTHGFSKHPLHQLWASMIQRCTNPNHCSYHRYGGRGITVCDRWQDPWLFAEDIEQIGPRPEGRDAKGRVLYEFDRIDNDGNYEPGNVRWADRPTQRANQRTITQLTRERDALAARVAELEALAGLPG